MKRSKYRERGIEAPTYAAEVNAFVRKALT